MLEKNRVQLIIINTLIWRISMNDFKWFAIMLVGSMAAIFGCLAYSEHTKSECRVAGFAAHQAPADVQQVCGE